MKRPPTLLFDVPIADVTMEETLELIDQLVAVGRARGTTHQISTVNVDFLVNALGDRDVASILRGADVCLADGMPVVWGAHLLGMPIRERVAGSDLVPLLIGASQSTGRHVHVFGSTPDVADASRELLRERYPKARFSIDPGPVIPDVEHVDDEVLDSILAVDADILCVALGNPKQERFIRAHRGRLGTPVMIGVGGSLDMLVGKRRRAPSWVQRIGLEWVARAVQEPRRLGPRYAHDIRVFVPAFAAAWRRNRRASGSPGLQLEVSSARVDVRLEGGVTPHESEWASAASTVASGAPLHVDLRWTTSAPDTTLARVVGLVSIARIRGVTVTADGLDPSFAEQLSTRGLLTDIPGVARQW